MAEAIILHPVEMTPVVMSELEQSRLIIRLAPRRHELPAKPGEARWECIYASSESNGPHMLITVSVNSTVFGEFGNHPDNEEFLLIGDTSMKPLYLVVARCSQEELERRAKDKTLSADHFVCLRVRWNDPEVSFFTMLAGVPHGESVGRGEGWPATFYVTEPRDLGTELADLDGYELVVGE